MLVCTLNRYSGITKSGAFAPFYNPTKVPPLHDDYFSRGFFPPIDRVYSATIRSGIDPSLDRYRGGNEDFVLVFSPGSGGDLETDLGQEFLQINGDLLVEPVQLCASLLLELGILRDRLQEAGGERRIDPLE
jgi:hypothetical protein